jgi:hypothetical protein
MDVVFDDLRVGHGAPVQATRRSGRHATRWWWPARVSLAGLLPLAEHGARLRLSSHVQQLAIDWVVARSDDQGTVRGQLRPQPEVYAELVKLARRARTRTRRTGIELLFAVVRWRRMMVDAYSGFKQQRLPGALRAAHHGPGAGPLRVFETRAEVSVIVLRYLDKAARLGLAGRARRPYWGYHLLEGDSIIDRVRRAQAGPATRHARGLHQYPYSVNRQTNTSLMAVLGRSRHASGPCASPG